METGLLWFCNWSTLGVCAALKLPQISALLKARSARGISLPSLLLELAGFLVFLRYQHYYGYPLLTYLEYPILIAQDIALLLCVFHFNGNVKQAAPYIAVHFLAVSFPVMHLVYVSTVMVCLHYMGRLEVGRVARMAVAFISLNTRFVSSWYVLTLQKWIIDTAMNLCTLISAASKFAQLQYLWKMKDSGAVSALTWSLSSYTCATRIVTTLMTTSDLTILLRFVIMLAFNVWVTATVLHYQKTTVKGE